MVKVKVKIVAPYNNVASYLGKSDFFDSDEGPHIPPAVKGLQLHLYTNPSFPLIIVGYI